MLIWTLFIAAPSDSESAMLQRDILPAYGMRARTILFWRRQRWRVGKIGGAGIMPSDDCIRRRLEARAEHVRAGLSPLQHDFAGDCVQPLSSVLPYFADCRGYGDEPDRGAHQSIRFDFGLDDFPAAGKSANCFGVSR